MSREAGVYRGEAGDRLKVSADTVDRRCVSDASAIREQHTQAAVAAQNARSVSGLVVAWVVAGMAVPLDNARIEVVVRRLDDGQPQNRRKLQQKRSGGGLPGPDCVPRPQHVGKGSAGDRSPTRPAASLRPARIKARFLGVLEDAGTVESGKRADLVLLDADPTESLATLPRTGWHDGIGGGGCYRHRLRPSAWIHTNLYQASIGQRCEMVAR